MEKLTTPPTAKAPAAQFTGDVYVDGIVNPGLTGNGPSRLVVAHVRFAPCARTDWHSHALGQTLHVTSGIGLVATRDGNVIVMRAGDTVWTPPGEEHWHGATRDNFMSHFAMLEDPRDVEATTWLEPVTDETYDAAHRDV
ncbi:Cupin domain protein [Raineyella antarctica]|uniref:Cupin domain protein n=1 Tax=Raineyella antarctica TaxID=1577474 RepID=A0A1G6GEJ6_9ACTN|nr:cupin domain-containing protein [Raineyella antarctica]SDB80432.1 Cupin domain protein [Raineyella antarctica]